MLSKYKGIKYQNFKKIEEGHFFLGRVKVFKKVQFLGLSLLLKYYRTQFTDLCIQNKPSTSFLCLLEPELWSLKDGARAKKTCFFSNFLKVISQKPHDLFN